MFSRIVIASPIINSATNKLTNPTRTAKDRLSVTTRKALSNIESDIVLLNAVAFADEAIQLSATKAITITVDVRLNALANESPVGNAIAAKIALVNQGDAWATPKDVESAALTAHERNAYAQLVTSMAERSDHRKTGRDAAAIGTLVVGTALAVVAPPIGVPVLATAVTLEAAAVADEYLGGGSPIRETKE